MSLWRRRRHLINIASERRNFFFDKPYLADILPRRPAFFVGARHEHGRCNLTAGARTCVREYYGIPGPPAPGKSTMSTGIGSIGRRNGWASRRRAQAATPFIRNAAEVCSTCFPRWPRDETGWKSRRRWAVVVRTKAGGSLKYRVAERSRYLRRRRGIGRSEARVFFGNAIPEVQRSDPLEISHRGDRDHLQNVLFTYPWDGSYEICLNGPRRLGSRPHERKCMHYTFVNYKIEFRRSSARRTRKRDSLRIIHLRPRCFVVSAMWGGRESASRVSPPPPVNPIGIPPFPWFGVSSS